MNPDKLKSLQIEPTQKRRPQRMLWIIFIVVAAVTAVAIYLGWPRGGDDQRIFLSRKSKDTNLVAIASAKTPESRKAGVSRGPAPTNSSPSTGSVAANPAGDDVVLTVSGYIVNHERIEISPRYMGLVKWIGVKKGDAVTNNQVVVLLDDVEYRAQLHSAEARIASAKADVARAELDFERTGLLAKSAIESKKAEDDARLQLEAARALLKAAEAGRELAQIYLDWTVIRSPINGVVLEKLVQPNELVMPQSFGGARGPSTALLAVADPQDLQVEVDLNEADLSKVRLDQRCRISPEAYPDKHFDGFVAEIAPEANRQKGTLQVKVQIKNPDRFLTPELSAKVEFLKQ